MLWIVSISFDALCGERPHVLYVSCVPVSVKEEREVLAPMEEKTCGFALSVYIYVVLSSLCENAE